MKVRLSPPLLFPFSVLNFGSVRLRLRSCFDPDKSRLFADEGTGGARLTGKAALILFFAPLQGSFSFKLTPLRVKPAQSSVPVCKYQAQK